MKSSILTIALLIFQIGAGAILSERSLPGLAQAMHVLVSSILFGALVLMIINKKEINDPELGLNGK